VRSELEEEAEETESGIAAPAAGGTLVASAPELPELRDAMSLAWRVLLVWLAVLALFVVAGWVG
jgi:AmpE protein